MYPKHMNSSSTQYPESEKLTKWAEDPNRHFSKEDTDGQQAHEKMLNIRERPVLYVVTYVQNLKNKRI